MYGDRMPALQLTARNVRDQRDRIALYAAEQLSAHASDRWSRDNEAVYAKTLRDIGLHLDYLTDSLDVNDESIYLGYVESIRTLFDALGMAEDVLPITLNAIHAAVEAVLAPADARRVGTLMEQAADTFHLQSSVHDQVADEQPLSPLAQHYLNALLRMDRAGANHLILDAVQGGTPVREIYLDVFQQTMREIGRLWQLNRITVAHEHFCTAATQQIMAQLAPHLFQGERRGRRVIATCIGGELHEIGLRMVADFFEMDGWETLFLGANMPADSIADALEQFGPDLLAVSTTINRHVSRVRTLITKVRASEGGKSVKILVGGYPFLADSELWREIGADGYAMDALQAVATGNALVDATARTR